MDTVAELDRQIAILDSDISNFERGEFGRLEQEHACLVRKVQSLEADLRVHRYRFRRYKFLVRYRTQSKVRPTGVLICVPLLIAVFFLGISELLSGSIATAFLFSVVIYSVSMAVFSIRYVRLLFVPKTESLPRLIDEVMFSIAISISKLKKSKRELSIGLTELQPLRQHRNVLSCKRQAFEKKRSSLINSLHHQREKLLQQNWKLLRGLDWEQYLYDVCEALGYEVELTKASGDQGVDLIAMRGNERIAIQAKGYTDKVSNKAVQEVVAGQRFYKCNSCAVITNSSYRSSAFELAAVNGCVLIHDENFPGFVMGRVPLSQRTGEENGKRAT